MKEIYTIREAVKKLEHYCAYQDRCHQEVISKLWEMQLDENEKQEVIAQLINDKFLNEERFARSFARGKHRIKHWGKNRITNELKMKGINQTLIKIALKEIEEEYDENFDQWTERFWELLFENNKLKKRKKFCDYFLRRGFESFLIYDKVTQLEKGEGNEN
ncbi:regulatory protein RecX [Flavobacterium algicola]|uniref:regulatory protein RecX n=1 Tax=Flavobacterium algicola TaxID=556529 RepID=UPI001EFC6156|nr:regulatory protein RecX [Flavobacterium algicola]MCG9791755.1 RecX family transcriptional regulator [Flavobacterium algicola]